MLRHRATVMVLLLLGPAAAHGAPLHEPPDASRAVGMASDAGLAPWDGRWGPSEVHLAGPVRITQPLRLAMANVTIAGALIIPEGVRVELYGSRLSFDRRALASPRLVLGGELVLDSLHAYPDPDGPVGEFLRSRPDRPSVIDGHLLSFQAGPPPRFMLEAGPRSALTARGAVLADIEQGTIAGSLHVEDSVIRNSGVAFAATDVAGHALLRNRVDGVGTLYDGTRSDGLLLQGNDIQAQRVVVLRESQAPVVSGNVMRPRLAGVALVDVEDARVVGNTFTNDAPPRQPPIFQASVQATRGARLAVVENVVRGGHGFILGQVAGAEVRDNAIADVGSGLRLNNVSAADVRGNSLSLFGCDRYCYGFVGGFMAYGSQVTLSGNRLSNSSAARAIDLWGSDATVEDNLIEDVASGVAAAVGTTVLRRNRLLDASDGITLAGDALGVAEGNVVERPHLWGIAVRDGAGALRGNEVRDLAPGPGLFLKPRAGIWLEAAQVAAFEDNVMENNTVGLSIPHDARSALAVARGNLVNGRNVDGSQVPGEQLYFTGAACAQGLAFAGVVRDGETPPYRGRPTAQGAITAYDCGPVTVDGAALRNHTFGVLAVNVTSLAVRDSAIADTWEPTLYGGAFDRSTGALLASDVPAVEVARSTILRAAVGVALERSQGVLVDNVVRLGAVGLDAREAQVEVSGGRLEGAEAGVFALGGSLRASGVDVAGPRYGYYVAPIAGQGAGVTIEGGSLDARAIVEGRNAGLRVLGGTLDVDGLALIAGTRPSLSGVDAHLRNLSGTLTAEQGRLRLERSVLQGCQPLYLSGVEAVVANSTLRLSCTGISAFHGTLRVERAAFVPTCACAIGLALEVFGGEAVVVDTNFTGVRDGVSARESATVTVRGSNLVGIEGLAASATTGGSIDARETWWGAPGGPNSAGGGLTSGPVSAVPWLVAPNPGAGPQP